VLGAPESANLSPGRQLLDGPSGGLQLTTLVALLASTRTFAVDLRMFREG